MVYSERTEEYPSLTEDFSGGSMWKTKGNIENYREKCIAVTHAPVHQHGRPQSTGNTVTLRAN